MSHHLEGWTAIEFAERHGGTLKKYADPTERALKRVSIDKAKRVAREDSHLIYMDVPSGKYRKTGNPSRRAGKRETKAERLMRLQRSARKRGLASAAGTLLKKLNPASKVHAVRVKRLKGGGVTITPVKVAKR